MTDKQALRKLIEAVEGGSVRPYVIEEMSAAIFPWDVWPKMGPAYHGSLDAAKALHEALLPGWNATVNFGLGYASVSSPDHESHVTIWDGVSKWESVRGETYNAEVSDNPARALLLAILRAYEAQQ